MTPIEAREIQFSSFSLGDSFGKVFTWKGRLFRGIYKEARPLALDLFSSGLIDELNKQRLIPKTTVTDFHLEEFDLVIEHELIPSVSYPHEWSFTMLKDAALCVLKLNETSLKFGFETKDCHAYNVVFHNNRPLFVDIGSFVKVPNENVNLLCYEEFLMDYFHPLKIWRSGDYYTAKRIIADETGLLPHQSYLNIQYGFPLKQIGYFFTKARKGIFKALNILSRKGKIRTNTIKRKEKQVRHLYNCTKALSLPVKKSTWHNYHNEYLDAAGNVISSTKRFDRIVELLNQFNVTTLTELAGNQGVVSKLLLQKVPAIQKIICTDYDENAIDLLYNSIKNNEHFSDRLIPAVVNFMTPVPNYFGSNPDKRFASDCVLALAVTHHLILTQKFNIDVIISSIKSYTRKYLVTEFMPLGLWDGKFAPPYPAWYTRDWFVTHLEKHFRILTEEKTEENRITFFCELISH